MKDYVEEQRLKKEYESTSHTQESQKCDNVAVYPTQRLVFLSLVNILSFISIACLWTPTLSFPQTITCLVGNEIFSLFLYPFIFGKSPFVKSTGESSQANFGFRMLVTMLLVAFRTPSHQIAFALDTIINISSMIIDMVVGTIAAFTVMFFINL